MSKAQIATERARELKSLSSSDLPLQAKAANEADTRQSLRTPQASGKGLWTAGFYMMITLLVYIGWQYRGMSISPRKRAWATCSELPAAP